MSNLTVEETGFPGLLLLHGRAFRDDRGFLYESWREEEFRARGLGGPFVQDNHSRSRRGVLRGLHWQDPPHPQGKLVRCSRGTVWDAVVDLRVGSPTFGGWYGVELSGKPSGDPPSVPMLWVPPGFAHGFLSVSGEEADVQYRCTGTWNPAAERCLLWNDPDLGIPWPLEGEPLLSEKDARGGSFAAYRTEPTFAFGGNP